MVSLASLWIPIILGAVAVFMLSFVLHMVLKYHQSDFARLPGEDEVMAALRMANAPPGDYMFPHGGGPEAMKDPVWIEKAKRGPIGILTLMPPMTSERPSMGKNLVQWFIYVLVVSVFAAYVASRAVGPGAPGGEVMRFGATAAFLAYSMGVVQTSIWGGKKWSTTIKSMVDGLIYALATGAILAWMWP